MLLPEGSVIVGSDWGNFAVDDLKKDVTLLIICCYIFAIEWNHNHLRDESNENTDQLAKAGCSNLKCFEFASCKTHTVLKSHLCTGKRLKWVASQ